MLSIFKTPAIQPSNVLCDCILIFSSVVQKNLLACVLKLRVMDFVA